jgi:hypothetical protein
LKSLGELDRLVNEVILAEDFDKKDFSGFRAARESERLDNFSSDPRSRFSADDGWIETSIKISLPAEQVKHASEAAAPQFEVHGLFYRHFLEVLKSALHETTAEQYHLFPFQDFWRPSHRPFAPLKSRRHGLALIFGALSQSPVKHSIRGNCLLRKLLEADGRQHWQRNRGLPEAA